MSGNISYIDAGRFEAEVLKSDRPVIVDFYSEECPPCEVLAPIYEKMAEKYGGHLKFVKILRQANRDLAKSINVTAARRCSFLKRGRKSERGLTAF